MDKKAKARVAIAFDVLQSVDSLKVSNDGWYVAEPVGDAYMDEEGENCINLRAFKGNAKEDATKHLTKLQKCEVCALGACLISQVKLFNKMAIGKLVVEDRPKVKSINPDKDTVAKLLSRFFSMQQLDLIEAAFEACGGFSIDRFGSAFNFGKRYDDPKKRLKAIMANIIVNDGEFCP